MTQRVFITGASRGIGLELVRKYAAVGAHVFAAARHPNQGELLQLAQSAVGTGSEAGLEKGLATGLGGGKISLIPLEVTSEEQLAAAVAAVRAETSGLDILINNAGMNQRGLSLGSYNRAVMLDTLHTNAVAPILIGQAFLGLLRKGERPRLVHISSQVGSFTWNTGGRSPLYAASKAALNMYMRTIAHEAKDITTVAVHPGWVQTTMGGPSAPLTIAESVRHLYQLIDGLTPAENGHFLNYDGRPHPW